MVGNNRDRRAADEKTQPGTGSTLDSAVRGLWCVLFDLQLEWETRAAVVRAKDPVGITAAATALVVGWQVARDAQQTLRGAVEAAQGHERSASLALCKYRRDVQDLLRGALSCREGTAAHDDLARLIAEINGSDDKRGVGDGELCEISAGSSTT